MTNKKITILSYFDQDDNENESITNLSQLYSLQLDIEEFILNLYIIKGIRKLRSSV